MNCLRGDRRAPGLRAVARRSCAPPRSLGRLVTRARRLALLLALCCPTALALAARRRMTRRPRKQQTRLSKLGPRSVEPGHAPPSWLIPPPSRALVCAPSRRRAEGAIRMARVHPGSGLTSSSATTRLVRRSRSELGAAIALDVRVPHRQRRSRLLRVDASGGKRVLWAARRCCRSCSRAVPSTVQERYAAVTASSASKANSARLVQLIESTAQIRLSPGVPARRETIRAHLLGVRIKITDVGRSLRRSAATATLLMCPRPRPRPRALGSPP